MQSLGRECGEHTSTARERGDSSCVEDVTPAAMGEAATDVRAIAVGFNTCFVSQLSATTAAAESSSSRRPPLRRCRHQKLR